MFQEITAQVFPTLLHGIRYYYKKTRRVQYNLTHQRASPQYMTFALSHMFRICAIVLTFWQCSHARAGASPARTLLRNGTRSPYRVRAGLAPALAPAATAS